MCDSFVVTPEASSDGAMWLGKNSDREPGEAQFVEFYPARRNTRRTEVQCTTMRIAEPESTNACVISRPTWMWGAEMGLNERGVAIANEAVFTRLPVADSGLLGMDLLRLALERASTAREAIAEITELVRVHGQGGASGYRNRSFRYHNAFLITDATEAWVLETADRHWATLRVRGMHTISNGLSIGHEFDSLSPDALRVARDQGFAKSGRPFDFAAAFGDPTLSFFAGVRARRACSLRALRQGLHAPTRDAALAALRSHGGAHPAEGWRMQMTCAHASFLPTRGAGQTTGSMLARSENGGAPVAWFSATSSPCVSVFKRFEVGRDEAPAVAPRAQGFDPRDLFWQHERLHRRAMRAYERVASTIASARDELERATLDHASWQKACELHRAALVDWLARTQAIPSERGRRAFLSYWLERNREDRMLSVEST